MTVIVRDELGGTVVHDVVEFTVEHYWNGTDDIHLYFDRYGTRGMTLKGYIEKVIDSSMLNEEE